MALSHAQPRISAEIYLQAELDASVKHQLIDGEMYAMGGASENHNLLAGNIFNQLKNHLKTTPCRTFMADMKLRVAEDFFYPDVMVVVCQDENGTEYYKTAPVLIVEVLSKTTRKFDQTSKRLRCQSIPSLQEYVLIEQDKGEIQVFRLRDNWQSFYYYLGDRLPLFSLDLDLAVEDIYAQVNNEDVLAFKQPKQDDSMPFNN